MWETLTGMPADQVGAEGLTLFQSGQPLPALALNRDFGEVQHPTAYALATGVIAGGQCTATGLTVLVPAGTMYYARVIWWTPDGTSYVVPDGVTRYFWGCADGVVRVIPGSGPPDGWDHRSACLLCRVVSSGGQATIDLSVQWRARLAQTNNVVQEVPGCYPVCDRIPDGASLRIPDNSQIQWMDSLSIYGSLEIRGKGRIL